MINYISYITFLASLVIMLFEKSFNSYEHKVSKVAGIVAGFSLGLMFANAYYKEVELEAFNEGVTKTVDRMRDSFYIVKKNNIYEIDTTNNTFKVYLDKETINVNTKK